MEGEQLCDPSGSRQEERDYASSLEPGYCFSPTDSELIVHYLKRKIETGKHPKCRIYEINLYDHNPQELSERYPSLENKWYFLTSRERKYPRGTLPSRRTKKFGVWRTTQKYKTVYNDMIREAVGSRRSFTYYDDKGNKTLWRMYEYTTNDPNIPLGSDGNKLSDCVLRKVYKKETIPTNNNKQSGQVPNERNQEQNQLNDEPPIKRRRVFSGNQANGIERIPNSKADVQIVIPYQHPVNNIVGFGQPIPPQTLQFSPGALMHTRTNPKRRGSSSAVEAPFQVFAREQVGPYSDTYGGDMTGRVPNLLTSTEGLLEDPTLATWTDDGTHEDLVTWINNNIDVEQSPLTLANGPHEDPTLMTSTNNIAERHSPLMTLTHGWHEDPTLLTCTNKIYEEQSPFTLTLTHGCHEDPTLMTSTNNIAEIQSPLTTLTHGCHEDPTLMTSTNNIAEKQSPLTTLTHGWHEDPTLLTSTNNIAEKQSPLTTLTHGWHPTLLTCTNMISKEQSPLNLTHKLYEDPTLVTWPESPIEDPTYKTWTYYGFDEDIASLLMNIF